MDKEKLSLRQEEVMDWLNAIPGRYLAITSCSYGVKFREPDGSIAAWRYYTVATSKALVRKGYLVEEVIDPIFSYYHRATD